jgi:hypothetical protein
VQAPVVVLTQPKIPVPVSETLAVRFCPSVTVTDPEKLCAASGAKDTAPVRQVLPLASKVPGVQVPGSMLKFTGEVAIGAVAFKRTGPPVAVIVMPTPPLQGSVKPMPTMPQFIAVVDSVNAPYAPVPVTGTDCTVSLSSAIKIFSEYACALPGVNIKMPVVQEAPEASAIPGWQVPASSVKEPSPDTERGRSVLIEAGPPVAVIVRPLAQGTAIPTPVLPQSIEAGAIVRVP